MCTLQAGVTVTRADGGALTPYDLKRLQVGIGTCPTMVLPPRPALPTKGRHFPFISPIIVGQS